MGLGEPPSAVCTLEVLLSVSRWVNTLSGVMLRGARMPHVLFHHENFDLLAMACCTWSALETSGGAVGPQR